MPESTTPTSLPLQLIVDCYVCGAMFVCNPATVVAYEHQPICKRCAQVASSNRVAQGKPPLRIAHDAYPTGHSAALMPWDLPGHEDGTMRLGYDGASTHESASWCTDDS